MYGGVPRSLDIVGSTPNTAGFDGSDCAASLNQHMWESIRYSDCTSDCFQSFQVPLKPPSWPVLFLKQCLCKTHFKLVKRPKTQQLTPQRKVGCLGGALFGA